MKKRVNVWVRKRKEKIENKRAGKNMVKNKRKAPRMKPWKNFPRLKRVKGISTFGKGVLMAERMKGWMGRKRKDKNRGRKRRRNDGE